MASQSCAIIQIAVWFLFVLVGTVNASAKEVLPGLYRAVGEPDVASQLLIYADGRFQYMLSAGALDETARGYWKPSATGITLHSDPKPVLPTFALLRTGVDRQPFTVRIEWPNGEGIAGVDFRLGLTDGTVIENYTQQDGWTMSSPAARRPAWIEVYEPIHGIASPRYRLSDTTTSVTIKLTPNDLGVVDFDGSPVEQRGKLLILYRRRGELRYMRLTQ